MKTSVVVVAMISMLCLGLRSTLTAQGMIPGSDRYYLDVHDLEPGGVTYAAVAGAHEKDLQTQDKYGVSFITYWVDEEGGKVYCLSKARTSADVSTTHAEAHGLVPSLVYHVIAGEQAIYSGNGSLFLDIHELGPGNVTAEAVADAHLKDLEAQGDYKVNFINYWVDEEKGKVFCLSEAPNKEAVMATHEHAHGLIPAQVVSVKQGQ